MITHVVMFRFKGDVQEEAATVKGKLDALPAQIPEIKYYETGVNIVKSDRSYDLVLISKFDSLETMAMYSQHPAHLEVLTYIKQVTTSIVAADFES